ncbi:energy transducer TonB [Nonomuraea sp. B12E4]|uniref:energy transducer TonB family protein n=1 Tax=Nonomuraea sp. B12E4 TaxID=3153564 RepID=UPI00325DB686
MESGDDRANRLHDLLNWSTPFAPGSAEEVRERLTSRAEEPSEVAPAAETPAAEPQPQRAPVADAGIARRPLPDGPVTPPVPRPPVDPLDLFGGARTVLAEIGGLTDALRTARQRYAGPATGEDGSGTIAVTLAPDGTLDRLSFRRPWQKALPFEAFDQAVLEAISNAVLARFTGMLPEEGVIPPATGLPPVPEFPAVPAPGLDAETVLRQANLLFAELATALTTARRDAARATPAAVTIKSRTGRVTLTLTGEVVTGVATEPAWLRTARETRLAEEFGGAFERANQVITDRQARPAAETVPGLRQLTKVTSELKALTRGLGLPF